MKKIYTLCMAVACTFAFFSNAQDAHYTQYYTFAQALNPALTGNFEGSYRFALMYRNQWNSFLDDASFVTPGAAIDLPLFEGQLKNDKLGIGLLFVNDRFGEGSMSVLNTAFSLAYHKGFGKKGKHRISLGGQIGFVQKSIDSEGFIFYDQFDEITFGPVGVSQDEVSLDRGSFYFIDYNFGLYWKSSFTKHFGAQGGFSMFHTSQPTEYFIDNNDDYYLPRRYAGDVALNFFVNDKFMISPDMLYMRQGDFQEITTGAMFGWYFNSGFRTKSSLHIGARYRVNDAVTPMLQVEFRNLRIGGAYDVNTSSLKESSDLKGSFEISIVYVGESIKSYKANKSLPARRF